MLELIAYMCLIANPTACKDVSLAVAEVTPQQCILGAQGEAKKWIDEHPGWQVNKLTCGRVGRYARI